MCLIFSLLLYLDDSFPYSFDSMAYSLIWGINQRYKQLHKISTILGKHLECGEVAGNKLFIFKHTKYINNLCIICYIFVNYNYAPAAR